MNKEKKIITACAVWIVITAIGAIVWKLFVMPHQSAVKEQVKIEEHKKTILQTSSESRYKVQIDFALDSFSGYSIFRSEEFQNELTQKKIKVNITDDSADYNSRLKNLQTGNTQIAVFTIDALIKASATLGDLPATIVCLVDETRGADAMVAYSSAVSNIDALNNANMKFVLTPDSPSETLTRVVMSHFGLSNLSKNPFIVAKDADDVYRQYRASKPGDQQVFVLWEPYVTKMLENPNTQIIVDSSRFRGYIVDVIVCSRDFLLKNEEVVTDFVEAYLRANYFHNKNMAKIVGSDSAKSGTPLSDKQIERLVNGIWWKNTSENFAHMGLNSDRPLQHVEDMLRNITNVLLTTGAMTKDPTDGHPNLLYYDKVLAKLKNNNFHPGVETIRKDSADLPVLSDSEWDKLVPVGTLQVPPLVFARGTAMMSEQSIATLNDLIAKLASWPSYYLMIRGNASTVGDLEANKILSQARAKIVEQYLLEHGVSKTRVKSVGVEPSGSTSVVFQLGYTPY